MSGNPFRRAPQQRQESRDLRSESPQRLRTPPDDRSKPKKKKVVIQTPPHSPEQPVHEPSRRLSDGRTGSPPPPPGSLVPDDDTDSTATADSDLDTANLNTRGNSGPLHPPPTSFHTQSGTRAPYNPFARTLATSEAAYEPRGSAEENGDTDEPLVQRGSGRPALDVDAFKNILMTGTATPPRSQPPTDHAAPALQPAFNSVSYQETPTRSLDGPHSDSSEDEDDNVYSSLIGPVDSRPEELAPQVPPKQVQGPQTVSFADFEDFTQSSQSATSPTSRPAILRNASGVNKPLPVLPEASRTPASGVNGSSQAIPDPQQKNAAPPPPSTRRPRQHAPSTGRPGSSSNQTQKSVVEEAREAQPKPSRSPAAAPPPPPPARRGQPVQTPAAESPPLPPQTQAETTTAPIPPPPPRRNPSKAGSASLGRTSSASSRTSIPKDNNAAANAAAPPPPPPRRAPGGSKRFSSTSQQILENEASDSTMDSRPPERDFLSDLDAFQAEIDALRAQASKPT